MSDTERSREMAAPVVRPRGRMLAAILVVGFLAGYAAHKVEHQVYAMGYEAGGTAAAVETWSLPLPAGFEIVYWKSTPHSDQDGIRLFQTEER